MSPDGWYALLGGDVIVHHGLPSHDMLTVWGLGRRWVDQQWLAQIATYELFSLGGLRLILLTNAVFVAGSFAAAVGLARARGGARRDVLYVSAVAAIAFGFSSSALRPQTLALPLFVAAIWLLIDDAQSPSRRVFWIVPLLVLWANLHGSVTLAVLLVLLAVLAGAWSRRALSLRAGALAVLAVAAPFASPYAPHLLGYYRAILFNREFAKYLPDWMPTALGPRTAAFYLLAFAVVVALARATRALTAFERVALVALLVLAVDASRGVTWFTLFALVTLPRLLRDMKLPALPALSEQVRTRLVAVIAAAVVLAIAVAASRSGSWFASNYPPSGARAVTSAAGTHGNVFANGAFADWLLFTQPSLRGRVAYDARVELLPHGRLADAVAVSIARWDAERILKPFDVLVLRPQESELRAALERAGGWTRVPSATELVVLRRV